MGEKEIKINVPDGYEIDKENSTFECIKFKPIKKELPKSWEEYCEEHPRREGEIWITQSSKLDTITNTVGLPRDPKKDKNLLSNKEYAEAMLALCQLIQLRDCYNDGWTPDWIDNFQGKFCIYTEYNKVNVSTYAQANRILAFKTAELRDEFLKNFKDLIEVAKPLL